MAQQVDFYLLSKPGSAAREQFACRLINKVYRLGEQVHVEIDNATALQAFDEMLWTFSDDSFVPHTCLPDDDTRTPVTLGLAGQPALAQPTVYVNLTSAALTNAQCRIAEIVPAEPDQKALGRQRYAAYRDRGCDIATHNL
ncbi:MAG: DNA polymerase III subunit chi [Pseudomonadota bacterium]